VTIPRNPTIDIAKGLGILLVVFGHNWWVLVHSELLYRVVYSFHVPLFFFLSGIFLKEAQPLPRTAVSRLQTLLWPYALVMALGAVIVAVTQPQLVLERFMAGAIYASGPVMPNPWGALWFLPHLFVATLTALALIKAVGPQRLRRPPVATLTLCVLLGLGIVALRSAWHRPVAPTLDPLWRLLNTPEGLPGLPFSLDLLGISTAFLLGGWVLSDSVKKFDFRANLFVIALAVFVGLHIYLRNDVQAPMDLSLRLYAHAVLSTLLAISGIHCVLSLSALLARWPGAARVLSYIGASSLVILLFHVFFQARLTGFVQARWPQYTPLGATLAWGIGVAAPLALGAALRRGNRLFQRLQ
jgi:fucose 4-O-acetylase-like acetyltransferase